MAIELPSSTPGLSDPTKPPNYGNTLFFGKGGTLPGGVSMVNGLPTAADTSMAGPNDKVITWPDGHKTILMANGLSVDVPAPGGGGDSGGGGGGGGGGGAPPPPLALPPMPKPQQIPFPQQAGASSLGAPNQTWDWLLEMMAAPGLLPPAMNQMLSYLAQNSTANNAGYSPLISQSNFGGLFGGQGQAPPFANSPQQPFLQQMLGNTLWQGASPLNNLGVPALSGGLHPGGLVSGRPLSGQAGAGRGK